MPQISIPLLAALLVCALSSSVFTLVKHSVDTGARCLDGSSAALYYSLGSGVNQNQFLIFFEGGGLCTGANLSSTLDSCYKRSQSDLGSSNKYPASRDLSNYGVLSGNSAANPVFFDWTRVFVPYCDGSEHMGTRQIPISYKGLDLYFRGTNNTIAHLNYLNATFGLFSSDQIVVTGISAGGMATYYWANYVYDNSINKQVVAIPDSGLFLVEYVNSFGSSLSEYIINLFKLMDNDVDLPMPECKTAFPDDPMQCYSANNIAKFIKPPIFIIESQYDMWSIKNILWLTCVGSKTVGTMTNCSQSDINSVELYRTQLLSAIREFSLKKSFGVWAPSCIQHGFIGSSSLTSPSYKIPTNTGTTIADALKKFLANPESGDHIYIDTDGWPSNKGCSGVTDKLYYLRHHI